MNNKEKIRFTIKKILLLIIVLCLFLIGIEYCYSDWNERQQDELRSSLDEKDESQKEPAKQESDTASEEESPNEPVIMEKYTDLYEENHDLAGWISIEGTPIDYPVMQCDDNFYYLHHDFYKNDSKYGCLYVKDIADINTPGTNFVIYGHNMKDGSMFGELDNYEGEEFFREHSVISFDTLYEERTYEIMAVFRSQIYDKDEDVFKYYQFYQADTEEEFLYFYNHVMEMALYDTGVTAAFGDTFLTLSTCAYHVEDGRFVVVAKRIK